LVKVLYDRLAFINSSELLLDFINKSEKIAGFYPLHFKDESAWRLLTDKIKEKNADYNAVSEIIRRQNINLGASQETLDNIDKLSAGNAFAIVTGQQATIFTGPLYTIYKALTAIKLSKYLSEKYQADFIPIFWTESNDHDFEEANHIYLLDQNSDSVKLEYTPSQYTPDSSIKNISIEDGFAEVINTLEGYVHDTEFKNSIFEIIRKSYQLSQSLSYGFGQMMTHLLGKYGLVMLDPSDPELKSIMSPIFKREIEFPLRSMEIVNSAGKELESLGYESQIEKSEDSTCLFIEEDKTRRKLYFRNNYFEIDGTNLVLSKNELLETLQIASWRFSPNVALRPVIQDYLLPTAAYIAGPGEISYFAQLNKLYEHFGVNMPIIYPRASFTIVESKVQRVIEKNELELSDMQENYESLFSRISKEKSSDKLEGLIEPSRSEIEGILKELSSQLFEIDTNLGNVAESIRKKIDQQINILKDKAYQIQRSRDDTMRNQIKRACMNIYPDGKPQERTFNIVQYLVLYGTQFLDEIESVIALDDIRHTFLLL
jgi:bacillithiol biosynthesis cysteine-adding enzyme BshC